MKNKMFVENDGIERDDPIRQLNVKYDIPAEVSSRMIGSNPEETKHFASVLSESIEAYTKRQISYSIGEVLSKTHEYLSSCLYEMLSGIGIKYGYSIGKIPGYNKMSILLSISNMLGSFMESICDSYSYGGIRIADILSTRADNPIIGKLGIRYHDGDKINGGVIPYGWNRDDSGRIYPNNTELLVIANMYEWLIDGASYEEISDKLNELGIPSRFGKGWDRVVVRKIIYGGMELI